MNHTTETIATLDASLAPCGRRRTCRAGRRERQRSMWPVAVVVVDKHFKDPLKVLLVQNQQPVETFRPDGAHESLGDSVGLWRAKRCTNDLNPFASEHVVKSIGEFLIPIANQKPVVFHKWADAAMM